MGAITPTPKGPDTPKAKAAASAQRKAALGGRRRVSGVGDWLPRIQIAERSKIDRGTVAKYLAMAGAPQPDEQMRWNYREALAWIDKKAPRISSNADKLGELRETGLRIKNELATIELKERTGQFVDKKEIEPTIAKFCTQLTEDLRAKFELELPAKYAGHTTGEVQQMNAAAVDWVLARLKHGAAPIANT